MGASGCDNMGALRQSGAASGHSPYGTSARASTQVHMAAGRGPVQRLDSPYLKGASLLGGLGLLMRPWSGCNPVCPCADWLRSWPWLPIASSGLPVNGQEGTQHGVGMGHVDVHPHTCQEQPISICSCTTP